MKNDFTKLVGKKNIALSLEGGGARGAYQIGAVKALYEYGFKFKAIVGTSIGAINGAYLAQGDFEKIYKMWQTMSFEDLLDLDNEAMKNLINVNLSLDNVRYLSKKLGYSIKNGGLDITNERKILEEGIDEKKLRNSDILYGLVATCLTDIKGEELFVDEIEEGKVVDYIIASSNLPVFKRSMIGDKKYLDGGLWDNCPVHMLEQKGFNDVIVIRAHKRNRIRDYKNIVKRGNIRIHMVEPIDTLPGILNFDKDNLNELLLLGYYDVLRLLYNYDGYRYYFKNIDEKYILEKVNNIPIEKIIDIVNLLKVRLVVGEDAIYILKTKIIPFLVSKTKVKSAENIKDAILALIEHLALNEYINKYQIYEVKDMINLIKQSSDYNELSTISKAMYIIVTNLLEEDNERKQRK